MVCLDTSFIIALIRRDQGAESKLESHIASEARLSTTPIAACELFRGAYKSMRKDIELKKVRDILGQLEILHFTIEACERYGKLAEELEAAGRPIGDLDAMIASLALTHNEPILTSDKHFKKVPSLIIETW